MHLLLERLLCLEPFVFANLARLLKRVDLFHCLVTCPAERHARLLELRLCYLEELLAALARELGKDDTYATGIRHDRDSEVCLHNPLLDRLHLRLIPHRYSKRLWILIHHRTNLPERNFCSI